MAERGKSIKCSPLYFPLHCKHTSPQIKMLRLLELNPRSNLSFMLPPHKEAEQKVVMALNMEGKEMRMIMSKGKFSESVRYTSEAGAAGRNMSDVHDFPSVDGNPLEEPQGIADLKGRASQHHPSNWVDADDDDDEGEESELCVQSTPPYH